MSGQFQISPSGMKRLAILAFFTASISNAYISGSTLDGADVKYVVAIIVMFLCLSAALVMLPRIPQTVVSDSPVRMPPRFWGFVVDFLVGFMITHTIWFLLNLTLPASQQVLLKTVEVVAVLSAYAFPFLMSWRAFKKDSQTPGQYMMQFKIVPLVGETPHFGKRVIYFPALIFSVNTKDGVLVTDQRSNTRVRATRT